MLTWGTPPTRGTQGGVVEEPVGDNDLQDRWTEVREANRLTLDHWEYGEGELQDALAVARVARSEGLTVDENTLPRLGPWPME